MKLAAIDIGSNAMRLQIVRVFDNNEIVSFKKLEYLRFPLRLGNEVFQKKKISKLTQQKFIKLMKTFKLLIELYEIDNYRAVATSAMREAENGIEVQKLIKQETDIDIEIISGESEAFILNKAITPSLGEGECIHIDVGGGSTEINIYDGKQLKKSQSFRIGSVRKLNKIERAKTLKAMSVWCKKALNKKNINLVGIGTGGNISKLFKIANKAHTNVIGLAELKAVRAYVKAFNITERIEILKMNPDRADVIIPASEIYINVLTSVGSDYIIVPDVGLKDGLLYELFESTSGKQITALEFVSQF